VKKLADPHLAARKLVEIANGIFTETSTRPE
jgi:hypothetical protein